MIVKTQGFGQMVKLGDGTPICQTINELTIIFDDQAQAEIIQSTDEFKHFIKALEDLGKKVIEVIHS